ncbi:MAG: arsenic resistance N-acetyltransferase ArsN2 [Roseiflexaceae bacterium]|nr:arsenic resistance N-acetyltransferase ArsN2 [Roseiflexus sp.]MDW8212845.1 arsenic resistance N-acetyltransferase ArsN2 [Roseiflexaceae bacterium]
MPRDGLTDHLDGALVARHGPTLIGCAAVECYDDAGLLRSVAVDAAHRGRGVGAALVRAAVELTRRRGVRTLYLLTMSAADYFARFGFRTVSREEVAPAVQRSAEFNGVCPATAIVMKLDLQKETSMTQRSSSSGTIKDQVRDHYAQRIQSGSCCSSVSGSGDGTPTEIVLYGAETIAALPTGVVTTSFGCGNPVALASLRAGEVVLDLGSGGGLDVLLAAQRVGATGYVYGLDMTDEMLAVARRNAERAGATNVEFLKGDIENIPLPSNTVDVIISNCVINLTPDKALALKEAFRVLKPGGRLAVSDIVIDGDLSRFPVSEDQIRAALSWVGCIAGALTVEEYRTLLSDAGFTDIAVTVQHRYTINDVPLETSADLTALPADVVRDLAGCFTSSAITARKPQ